MNNTNDDTVTEWVRDGLGRSLTVTVNGTAQSRVFDGTALVVDGDTRITRASSGAVLFEAFEMVEGNGNNATTVTVTRDVLTDVLGSAIAVAEDGIINADLVFYTDFGAELFTPERQTVTGFTGRTHAGGLIEFETRAFDPVSKVWVQEDLYPGTHTRASSMNRYTYVEGAPETYADAWGMYRAASAIAAQQLSAKDYAEFMAEFKILAIIGWIAEKVEPWENLVQRLKEARVATRLNELTYGKHKPWLDWQSGQTSLPPFGYDGYLPFDADAWIQLPSGEWIDVRATRPYDGTPSTTRYADLYFGGLFNVTGASNSAQGQILLDRLENSPSPALTTAANRYLGLQIAANSASEGSSAPASYDYYVELEMFEYVSKGSNCPDSDPSCLTLYQYFQGAKGESKADIGPQVGAAVNNELDAFKALLGPTVGAGKFVKVVFQSIKTGDPRDGLNDVFDDVSGGR